MSFDVICCVVIARWNCAHFEYIRLVLYGFLAFGTMKTRMIMMMISCSYLIPSHKLTKTNELLPRPKK